MRKRLDGWKEIAAFLGRSEATAKRWEQKAGLPVRRAGGSVFAFSSELNEWLRGEDGRTSAADSASPWSQRAVLRAGVVGLAGVLAGFGLWLLSVTPNDPYTVSLSSDETQLQVRDERGEIVWTKSFGVPIDWNRPESFVKWVVVDLNGDGRNDVVCEVNHQRVDQQYAIIAFDHAGTELWRYTGGYRIELDGQTYGNTYRQGFLAQGKLQNGEPFFTVVARQHPHHPTQISVLNRHGDLIGEYWNSGFVFDYVLTDVDDDGADEILFVGVNNDLGLRPVAGLIEADVVPSISPGPTVVPGHLRRQTEIAYAVFPLTSPAAALGIGSWAKRITPSDGLFSIEMQFSDASGLFERMYLIDRNLEVVQVTFPEDFRRLFNEYRGLEGLERSLEAEERRALQVGYMVAAPGSR